MLVEVVMIEQDKKVIAAFFDVLNHWRMAENAVLFWYEARLSRLAKLGLGGVVRGGRRRVVGCGGLCSGSSSLFP